MQIDSRYHKINNWKLGKNKYLFFDIFARNNEVVIISTVYLNFEIDHDNISVSFNGKDLERNIIKYIEKEPAVACIYKLPKMVDQMLSVMVKYKDVTKKYDLYHANLKKTFNLMAGTLFFKDYYILNTWLNYYNKLGVEYFVIYYNGKLTNTIKNIIKPYKNVLLLQWDYLYVNKVYGPNYLFWHHAQTTQMNDLLYKYAKPMTKWLAYLDLDEYFQINRDHLQKLLLKYANKHAILFKNRWAYLDNNEIPKVDVAIDLTKKKIFRSIIVYKPGVASKVIYAVDKCQALGIHIPKEREKYKEEIVVLPNLLMLHFRNWSGKDRKKMDEKFVVNDLLFIPIT